MAETSLERNYRLVQGLGSMKQKQKIMAPEMGTRFENIIYRAAIGILQSLENQGMITGNGHCIAQDIAAYAKTKLDDRMQISG